MAQKTVLAALNGYFNTGDGYSVESAGGNHVPATVAGVPVKRSVSAFRDELKALSDAEKRELAEGVVALTGDSLTPAK